jgi:hypothetical protein
MSDGTFYGQGGTIDITSHPTTFPSGDATFGDLHVGNVKDDDPQIIDQDNLESDTPPTPVIQQIHTPQLKQPTPATRLLTGTLAVDPAWGNTAGQAGYSLLLPADPNRKQLTLRVFSPTSVLTDYVAFADDPDKLYNLNGRIPMYHLDNIDLPHTGPVYVTNQAATGQAASSAVTNISYVAVTS